jgi:hypothetical protein
MVSEAFKKLPQSSEQILHPDKYFSYEAPTKVNLPELTKLLGDGWTQVDNDVNGEWGFYLILDQFLNDTAYSKNAAAGWSGDRFALYEESKSGRLFVAQMSVWDTPNDAREFFDAYAKRTPRRYPDAKPIVSATSDNTQAEWHTTEGDVVMQLRESHVMIIEGVPSTANKKGILNTLWQ